ncbi:MULTISPECIES: hypothetical protein [unclassified Colwellia]|jgi:Tfp pilus assembly protein PilF|uniref:hypothetical protein n=1 Tax=unclassified Colwellia TaxID=196834 RepID=UPI0015F4B1E8|nr:MULTISPECIES: hypothetical protein [unclassified Colwellia]MBA6253934.1 hypothetical protein [Colwellia sp. MB3u-55]MBA6396356.1 hypothetical protein [Colwellia sp. BRX10-4]
MKTTLALLTPLLITLLVSNPVSAFESDIALKVAVVKDTRGTQDIVKGNFNKSIKKLTKRHQDESSYNSHMSLCVAYLQADNAVQSESACTAAIDSIEAMKLNNTNALYLKSLSYSNRGISRYKNNDLNGALADLNQAILIDENTITLGNLKIIKQKAYRLASLSKTSPLIAD